MEEMKVISGQTLLKRGEVPRSFFLIKEGTFRLGSELFKPGSFMVAIEYLLEESLESDVVAETDGIVVKYDKSDITSNDEEYRSILRYLVELLSGSLMKQVEIEVIGDFERSVDVAKIAEMIDETEGEEEILSALEEMLSIQKLPDLPDTPKKAKAVVEMVSKEEDIIRYVLHRLAFVKKFPSMKESREYILDVIRTYMDEMEDRYGAMYAIKIVLLMYPNDDELVREALRRGAKISRMNKDPEWFEYLIRFLVRFPEEEVSMDEIS